MSLRQRSVMVLRKGDHVQRTKWWSNKSEKDRALVQIQKLWAWASAIIPTPPQYWPSIPNFQIWRPLESLRWIYIQRSKVMPHPPTVHPCLLTRPSVKFFLLSGHHIKGKVKRGYTHILYNSTKTLKKESQLHTKSQEL